MKMIRELEERIVKNRSSGRKVYIAGEFECPVCGDIVVRIKSDGKKQKRCCGGSNNIFPKGSKIHNTYIGMTQRCWDKNAINYKNYGGRGIKVCKPWHNFNNFAKWAIANGFKEGLQIDRIDNDGDYEPSNCRFVTRAENMHNTSTNIHTPVQIRKIRSLYATGKYTQKKLSEIFNDSQGNISNIILCRSWGSIDE